MIDSGLYMMKIGFGGDEAPRYTERSLIGYSKNNAITASEDNKALFVGENVLEKSNFLWIEDCMTSERKCDMKKLEIVWHNLLYDKMKVDPCNFSLILTMSPYFDDTQRKDIAEIFFESFNINALYNTISNVTGIYSEGKTTGMVVDSGYVGAFALNIFEGYPILDR